MPNKDEALRRKEEIYLPLHVVLVWTTITECPRTR